MKQNNKSDKEYQPRTVAAPWMRLFRSHQWVFIAILAVIAFIMGYYGFEISAKPEPNVSTKIYLTLQLFTLTSGYYPIDANWTLDIARFLAPVVGFWAIFRLFSVFLGEQLQRLRVRLLRKHVVVCGLGDKGATISLELHKAGKQVVVIEKNHENPYIVSCANAGIFVFHGNATDAEVLNRAGITQASYLLAVCPDDETNLSIMSKTRELVDGRRKGRINCIVHLSDPNTSDLFSPLEIQADTPSFSMEIYDIYASGALAVLDKLPDFSMQSEPYHLVIVGHSNLARNILLKASRSWFFYSQETSRISIDLIDPLADQIKTDLEKKYPSLSKSCELTSFPVDARSHNMFLDFLRQERAEKTKTLHICLCEQEDTQNLSVAIAIMHQLNETNNFVDAFNSINIVICIWTLNSMAKLLKKSIGSSSDRINLIIFDFLGESCQPRYFLNGTHEIIARSIHEDYLRREFEKGKTINTNKNMVPWIQLDEQFKDSNRTLARTIPDKLKMIGCDILPLIDWNSPLFVFSQAELDQLAEAEHNRWQNEKKKQGWIYASGPKNSDTKTHPDLVPWSQLQESEKRKNHDIISHLPSALALAGVQIVRPQTRFWGIATTSREGKI